MHAWQGKRYTSVIKTAQNKKKNTEKKPSLWIDFQIKSTRNLHYILLRICMHYTNLYLTLPFLTFFFHFISFDFILWKQGKNKSKCLNFNSIRTFLPFKILWIELDCISLLLWYVFLSIYHIYLYFGIHLHSVLENVNVKIYKEFFFCTLCL